MNRAEERFYQAGYVAGRRRSEKLIHLTPQQKENIAKEWLLAQRRELIAEKERLDREIAKLDAEESLRKSGFIFPPGF